jgi:transcriptional regulator with XRE-family HTH domain
MCVKTTPRLSPSEISGRRLIEARKAAGLTQVVVAERIGADQTTVSRIELGKIVHPPLDTIGRYCQIVGCNWLTIIEPYFEVGSKPRRRRALEQVAS